jgi:hypothetical protein
LNGLQVSGHDGTALPVGDPRRRDGRNAIYATFATAAMFVLFAVLSTQDEALRAHSPWQNDPYDAVVSFTVFFVPLVTGLCAFRVQLCRRNEPLPMSRLVDLLRGSRLVLAAIAATLGADWLSVAFRADRDTWTSVTVLLVLLLTALTATLLVAAAAVGAAGIPRVSAGTASSVRPGSESADWLTDLVDAVVLLSRRFGPGGLPIRRLAQWLADHLVAGRWGLRTHPILAAGLLSVFFGAILGGLLGAAEGPPPVVLLLVVIGVGACGMFAFLVIGGAYLGFVRGERDLSGWRRRLVDALTLGCAAVPVALAFRGYLWWIVGTRGDTAGIPDLARLVTACGLAVVGLAFAVETVLRLHGPRPAPGRNRR